MINYLDFIGACAPDFLPRLGGGASLHITANWPKDASGQPMLHLISLPGELVSKLTGIQVHHAACISVFIPYQQDSIEESISLARQAGTAQVLLYQPGTVARQEFNLPMEPARALTIDSDEDVEEEDEFSDEIENKIGGTPTWLQDRIDSGDMVFCLQLVGPTLVARWPAHRGLFLGGVGYLFLNKTMPEASFEPIVCGDFRVQYS